jgi:hypothetical protein
MQPDMDAWIGRGCRKAVSQVYRAILCLYPNRFRRRFGPEMNAIFMEAFDNCAHQGRFFLLVFLARELLEAPYSILGQHISEETGWLRSISMNLLPFTSGFILIGLLSTWNEYQVIMRDQEWVYLFGYVLAGGISGLGVSNIVAPRQKRLFAAGGSISALWAFMQYGQLCFCAFMVSIFYPLLMGCIIGLFLWRRNGRFGSFLRWAGLGILVTLASFFVNRFSSALIQSYVFRSPIQDFVTTGLFGLLAYIVFPYLLEGMLLGTLMSGITHKGRFREADCRAG